ncbi:MAG: hypothetical protein NTZ03_11735 [Actinobacteria bacterium]|nr:hypothetical protein [Actinomycetota bacterium]
MPKPYPQEFRDDVVAVARASVMTVGAQCSAHVTDQSDHVFADRIGAGVRSSGAGFQCVPASVSPGCHQLAHPWL